MLCGRYTFASKKGSWTHPMDKGFLKNGNLMGGTRKHDCKKHVPTTTIIKYLNKLCIKVQ
jgi:hypothetical protein